MSIITKEQIAPLLLEACPSFRPVYEESDYKELDYTVAGEFASHLYDLFKENKLAEFSAVTKLIENLHLNGDSYVKELATIGILEDIQNVWGNDAKHFECYLLPTSKKYWQSLNDFWDGKIPCVGADITEQE